jgi:hypothetical protein
VTDIYNTGIIMAVKSVIVLAPGYEEKGANAQPPPRNDRQCISCWMLLIQIYCQGTLTEGKGSVQLASSLR